MFYMVYYLWGCIYSAVWGIRGDILFFLSSQGKRMNRNRMPHGVQHSGYDFSFYDFGAI